MIYEACLIALFHQLSSVTSRKTCEERLKDNHVSPEYGWFAAHGSHSITLNEIQFYFEPTATIDNGITMVNFNLSGDILLPNAPWIEADNRFTSPALFALDHVLSNMDDNSYDFKNGNALDRIAHNLHMQEVWQNAAKKYKGIRRRKPKLCGCLEETYSSTVNESLHFLAKQIREPELMYTRTSEKRAIYSPRYGGGGGTRCRPWPKCVLFPPAEETFALRGGSNPLQSSLDSIVDEKTWDLWKNSTSANIDDEKKEEMASSFALFMKCNLQL